jgi:hypothetical protein
MAIGTPRQVCSIAVEASLNRTPIDLETFQL